MIVYIGPMTSLIALMHGMRVDWRWDAPTLARYFGMKPPRKPPPYLSDWLASHPVITNREVFHNSLTRATAHAYT